MSIAICHGGNGRNRHGDKVGAHCPLHLIAGSLDCGQGTLGMQATQEHGDYIVWGIRADGVIDRDEELIDDAEADDEPICAECCTTINHWQHEEYGCTS